MESRQEFGALLLLLDQLMRYELLLQLKRIDLD